jgi:hypothetical protein
MAMSAPCARPPPDDVAIAIVRATPAQEPM